jgi:hypothetical protein
MIKDRGAEEDELAKAKGSRTAGLIRDRRCIALMAADLLAHLEERRLSIQITLKYV